MRACSILPLFGAVACVGLGCSPEPIPYVPPAVGDDVVLDDDDLADDDDAANDDDLVDDDDAADDDDLADDDDATDPDVDPDDDDVANDDDLTDDDDAADDDDATPDCSGPTLVLADVELTDPSGAPTSTMSAASPLTVTLTLTNQGAANSYLYASSCLLRWDLWNAAGQPVAGGPVCLPAITSVPLACGVPPTTFSTVVEPIEGVSGNPAPAGAYTLDIDTYHFGVQGFTVSVP